MGQVTIGTDYRIANDAVVGYEHTEASATVIGDGATIRSGAVIYGDVTIGNEFATGHNVLIREETDIGDGVVVGTNAVVDGSTVIGSHASLQTGAYVPPETELGESVFLGPCAVLTNDAYPVRTDGDLDGPTLCDDVSVGANATILPGITVGERSFVAAGSVVTEDVPSETLAVGVPAEHRPLPDGLAEANRLA